MSASSGKKTLRARLRRLSRRALPRTWTLRASLRGLDRYFLPRIAQAKGDEREALDHDYLYERASVEEEIEGVQTQRLIRKAMKYYIVIPETPWGREDFEDENWLRGPASGTWHLKPVAVAFLRRQIEDAQSRRREVWATWAKILGGLIAGLVALVSALVSLTLAWWR